MITIIIQARMGSTRLPGKILKELAGKPMLWHIITRALRSKRAERVIVATSSHPDDDPVQEFCKKNNFLYFRGSLENVLERYYEAAKQYNADIIVRVTGDCPLIDPSIIDLCIDSFRKEKCDYISNVCPGERTFPRGLDCEIFSFSALEKARQNAAEEYEKEHVTPYIWQNKKSEFKVGPIVNSSSEYNRRYRLTVDYPEDFAIMEKIYQTFYKANAIINVADVLHWLDGNPDAVAINAHCEEKQVKI